ncbi:TetR/AcrR family transcriptional regulator [Actinomadura scrupuli]|uniref:TetR/AcrR family transcriptional regulator n=1 Tax=Actinomadura scrupuli TaxID=559629 RepID=UPI003D96DF41
MTELPPEPAASSGLRLAGTHEPGRPGLPRGRSSLPGQAVRDAQRARLLRAVIAVVADKGYGHTTVTDVVRGARVSRNVFYAHFADLETCFFAAVTAARDVIVHHLIGTTRDHTHDPAPTAVLRASVRAYLDLCAQEPEFVRCIMIELPAVGRRALNGRNAAYRQIAGLLRLWRDTGHPALPPVPDESYLAAVGAIGELVLAHAADGTTAALPALTDTATAIIERILAVPRDAVPPDAVPPDAVPPDAGPGEGGSGEPPAS